jgi:hypothetical protein
MSRSFGSGSSTSISLRFGKGSSRGPRIGAGQVTTISTTSSGPPAPFGLISFGYPRVTAREKPTARNDIRRGYPKYPQPAYFLFSKPGRRLQQVSRQEDITVIQKRASQPRHVRLNLAARDPVRNPGEAADLDEQVRITRRSATRVATKAADLGEQVCTTRFRRTKCDFRYNVPAFSVGCLSC